MRLYELATVKRLDTTQPPAEDEYNEPETELPPEVDDPVDEPIGDEFGSDEFGDDAAPTEEPAEPEDPDKAGLIRTVPGAHLVYKRAQEDGSYSELWSYKVDSLKQSMSVRNAILAGTDIERSNAASDDGSQACTVWTVGNVEMLSITGLPN